MKGGFNMEHSIAYLNLNAEINKAVINYESKRKFVINLFDAEDDNDKSVNITNINITNIKNYIYQEDNRIKKENKHSSKDSLLNLIDLLLTIIALINNLLPNQELLKSNELKEKEIIELQQNGKALNEILEVLKHESSYDEATMINSTFDEINPTNN